MRARRRVRELEAEVARLEDIESATQETVTEMFEDQAEDAARLADALVEIRDGEHGHPRRADGRAQASGRCRVCRIVQEAL